MHSHPTLVRPVDPSKQAKHRGLSRAARPDQGNALATEGLEADVTNAPFRRPVRAQTGRRRRHHLQMPIEEEANADVIDAYHSSHHLGELTLLRAIERH